MISRPVTYCRVVVIVVTVMGCCSSAVSFTNDSRCPPDFDPFKSCPSSMILPGGAGFDLSRNIDPTSCIDQENCPRCLGDDTWQQTLRDDIGLYTALRDPNFKPWVIVDNWLSHEVISTITMILLREAMNISARAATKYTEGNIDFICCPDFSVNMEQWATSGLFVNDTAENTLSTRPIGYIGQAGIFVPSYVLDRYPFAFTHKAYQFFEEYKNIFPPSFSTDCSNMTVPGSTAGCTSGNYVCETNLWTNTTCYDGKWFVPPQCNIPGEVGNPNTTHCQEVLMADPTLDSGYTEGAIQNNGLNMTGAYLGVARHNALVRELAARQKDFIFYWFEPDPLIAQVEGRRVTFGVDTPECAAQRNGDPTLNTAKCDLPTLTLLKRTRNDALAADVDFRYFFDTFSLTRDQIDALMLLHTTAGGTFNVYDISCNWIKDNYKTWKEMVQNTPSEPTPKVLAPPSALSNPGILSAIILLPILVVCGLCAVVTWLYCRRQLRLKNAPKTAPLAIVFTDIENSTMLWETYRDDMGLAVDIHHAIIRKHIEEFGAYEVKTIGDSFMIACSSLGDATLMCLAIQTSLGECTTFPTRLQFVHTTTNNPPPPAGTTDGPVHRDDVVGNNNSLSDWPPHSIHSVSDKISTSSVVASSSTSEYRFPIRVLMGLHQCHIVNPRIDNTNGRYDYYGHDVNVCARVAARAKGGQILVTGETMAAIVGTDEYPLMIAPQAVSMVVGHGVVLKGVSNTVALHTLAPQSQVLSRYIRSKALKAVSSRPSLIPTQSLLHDDSSLKSSASQSVGSLAEATDTTQQCSVLNAEQLKATTRYSTALLRLAFKAVPDSAKTEWLSTLAATLRLKLSDSSHAVIVNATGKQAHSNVFEELRAAIRENCAQSLATTNATMNGTTSGEDALIQNQNEGASTHLGRSIVSLASN